MNATSYKISKLLWKAGFRDKTIFYYSHRDLRWEEEGIKTPEFNEDVIPSYCLQTLISRLPYWLYIQRDSEKFSMGTRSPLAQDKNYEVEVEDDDESLADTAARLLLLLHAKKVINF
jgi:hypothetical protein